MGDSYSDPKFGIVRPVGLGVPSVNGAADTLRAQATVDRNAMLVRVHGVVLVAGTGATHGFRVKVGTASVGLITLGTNAAGAVIDSGDLSTVAASAMSSGGRISVENMVSEATGTATVVAFVRDRFV